MSIIDVKMLHHKAIVYIMAICYLTLPDKYLTGLFYILLPEAQSSKMAIPHAISK